MLRLVATAYDQAAPTRRLVAERHIGNLDIEHARSILRTQPEGTADLYPESLEQAVLGGVEKGVQGLFRGVIAQAEVACI